MDIVPRRNSLSLSLSGAGPTALCRDSETVTRTLLVFGGCAFPPVSLGPAGDCPCKD